MYFISFKGLIESKLSIISILSLTSTNNNFEFSSYDIILARYHMSLFIECVFLLEFKANWILPFFWFVSRNKFRFILISIKLPGNNIFSGIFWGDASFGHNGKPFGIFILEKGDSSLEKWIDKSSSKERGNQPLSCGIKYSNSFMLIKNYLILYNLNIN